MLLIFILVVSPLVLPKTYLKSIINKIFKLKSVLLLPGDIPAVNPGTKKSKFMYGSWLWASVRKGGWESKRTFRTPNVEREMENKKKLKLLNNSFHSRTSMLSFIRSPACYQTQPIRGLKREVVLDRCGESREPDKRGVSRSSLSGSTTEINLKNNLSNKPFIFYQWDKPQNKEKIKTLTADSQANTKVYPYKSYENTDIVIKENFFVLGHACYVNISTDTGRNREQKTLLSLPFSPLDTLNYSRTNRLKRYLTKMWK